MGPPSQLLVAIDPPTPHHPPLRRPLVIPSGVTKFWIFLRVPKTFFMDSELYSIKSRDYAPPIVCIDYRFIAL